MEGSVDREACPHCAEPAALDARICPYCQMSLLVSVKATAPVTDGRRRYQVARALSRLGPPLKDLRTVQSALTRGAPIATGLTRAAAGRILDTLAEGGLEGTVGVDRGQGIPGWVRSAGLGALAVGALVVAAWWAVVGGRPDTPPEPPSGPPAALTGAPPAGPPPPAAGPAAPDSAAVIRGALPSTVALRCGPNIGSGFFVSGELVLTNAHVLCEDSPVVVRSDGQQLRGAVLQRDDRLDLALVSVMGAGATPLPLGDAAAVAVGDRVFMVGSPMGSEFTVHEGIVSNHTSVLGVAYLQVDANVNPGNSGGPLLDRSGKVVGIVSLKRVGAEGMSFALPVNYAWSEAAFIPPPATGDSERFREMVAAAQGDGSALASQLEVDDQPGIVKLERTRESSFTAWIARFSAGWPAREDFAFNVLSAGEKVCTVKSSVEEWKEVEIGQVRSDRVQSWLQSHGLDARFYVGEAQLFLGPCPRQVRLGQLELVDGRPEAARVPISY